MTRTAPEQIAGDLGDFLTRPSQQPIDHPYARGKTHNAVSIATTATSQVSLVTAGFQTLTTLIRMTGTAASDLLFILYEFEDDGTTVFPVAITPDATLYGKALVGGVVYAAFRYQLSGVDLVRLAITNNNAASQTATCVYYLQK